MVVRWPDTSEVNGSNPLLSIGDIMKSAEEILKILSDLKCDFSSLETGNMEDFHTKEFKKIRARTLALSKEKTKANNIIDISVMLDGFTAKEVNDYYIEIKKLFDIKLNNIL